MTLDDEFKSKRVRSLILEIVLFDASKSAGEEF